MYTPQSPTTVVHGMPCLFPYKPGCIFPITCIVTYRTCIVAVSNVYPQLYPSSKCVFDTLRYTLDTKSLLWWVLSSVSSSGYRANFGEFCIVHVSGLASFPHVESEPTRCLMLRPRSESGRVGIPHACYVCTRDPSYLESCHVSDLGHCSH